MYNVKLDETNHYTGSYASIGNVEGGIDIDCLPPELDTEKALCYKYETHNINTTQQVPVMETNQETGIMVPKLDENGNPITTEETVTVSVTEWFLDDIKYNELITSKLATEKETKMEEIKTVCQTLIYSGTDVSLDSTTTNHFSFTLEDQSNIKALYDKAKSEATPVPYHADGELCRLFTVDEITKVYEAMESFKTYNTTLCNYIKMYIGTLTLSSEIAEMSFNIDCLSEEYKTQFNSFITSLTI